jgi:hypothetical protein
MGMGENMNQIRNALWKKHMEHPEIPFVGCTVELNQQATKREADGYTYYFLTIACCPHCGEQHHHGGRVPIGNKLRRGYDFGHRAEHCADRFVGKEYFKKTDHNGYFLVYTGMVEK